MRRRDHRDRDRDRDRDRGDRRRGGNRDSEKSGSGDSHGPLQGQVVLLKRPETVASASSAAATSSSSSHAHGRPTETSRKESQEKKIEIRSSKEPSQSTRPGFVLYGQGQGLPLRAESFPDLRGAGEETTTSVTTATSTIATTTTNTSSSTTVTEASAPDIKTLQRPISRPPPITTPEIKRPYQPNLKHAVPFINADDKMTVVQDYELEFIGPNANNHDFFVITAIGKPQSGKSAVLSYLASSGKFGSKEIFIKRKLHQEKECSIYITSNNVIFIEMASVFNGASTNDMITLMPQSTLEIATINWNMHVLNWAMSVSHVVLIVSESLVDPNFLQLINSTAMVHPIESVFGDGSMAEIVYVCNKASNALLEDQKLQEVSKYVFQAALGKPSIISRSFFVLPHLQTKSHEDRFEEFRDRIEDFIRYNRAMVNGNDMHKLIKFPQNISMPNWLSGCQKLWSDDTGSSPGFSSYVKLLP